MIIKSMGIKNPDWEYHYRYLQKDSSKMFSWNMSVDPHIEQDVIDEFQYNYSFLKHNSKAKNIYYHEVLSLPESAQSLSNKAQENALYDLADRYINARTDGNLVIGGIHQDTDKVHMHLVISSNSYLSQKQTRLTKKQFKSIQQDIEKYKNLKYPELKTQHYQPDYKAKQKRKQKEQEITHKRKRQTKKDKVLQDFKLVINSSKTKKEIFKKLNDKNYRLYRKGKNIGIINKNDNNRKYRLNTLEQNLSIRFVKRVKQLEQQQQIQYQALQQVKQQKGLSYEPKIR